MQVLKGGNGYNAVVTLALPGVGFGAMSPSRHKKKFESSAAHRLLYTTQMLHVLSSGLKNGASHLYLESPICVLSELS